VTGFWRPTTGNLESWIAAQAVEIIAVLIPRRDRRHARSDHLGIGMPHAMGITIIRQRRGDHFCKAELSCDLAQHDDTAIRRQTAAIEGRSQWFGSDRRETGQACRL